MDRAASTKPSVRPAVQALRAVVRMAADVAAQPVRRLWKNQLAPGNLATTMTGDDNIKKTTEDPKFRFWPNNGGDNPSKRVKNRTGAGENGTSKLCPRRRGKLEVPRIVRRNRRGSRRSAGRARSVSAAGDVIYHVMSRGNCRMDVFQNERRFCRIRQDPGGGSAARQHAHPRVLPDGQPLHITGRDGGACAKTGGGRVSAAPAWTGSVCNWPNGLFARPAGWVEVVNAMVAAEEKRSAVRTLQAAVVHPAQPAICQTTPGCGGRRGGWAWNRRCATRGGQRSHLPR
jgi:hypothetical protein